MGNDARGVFAISVAAEMVSMQIQNLRVYERRGLVAPARTAGGTRLYSQADITRLHRIRELLADGLNLAGIAYVIRLEEELDASAAGPDRPGRTYVDTGTGADSGAVDAAWTWALAESGPPRRAVRGARRARWVGTSSICPAGSSPRAR